MKTFLLVQKNTNDFDQRAITVVTDYKGKVGQINIITLQL